jgi:hypothetical protein
MYICVYVHVTINLLPKDKCEKVFHFIVGNRQIENIIISIHSDVHIDQAEIKFIEYYLVNVYSVFRNIEFGIHGCVDKEGERIVHITYY